VAVQSRGLWLLPLAVLATAAAFGVLTAIGPVVAVGVVAGLVFAYIVFADAAAGFAILAFLSFLDILPTSGSLSPAKGAGLLLAVAWLARFSVREREERDFFGEHPHLTWLVIGFLAWGAVTLLWAAEMSPGLTALSRFLPNMLLLPIAYAAVRERRDLILVLGSILTGAVVAAAFGILKPPAASIATEGRVTGTIGDPNELAAALLVGLAIATGFLPGRALSPPRRLFALIAIPLCAAGIFLSLSRGGLIALAAMLVAGPIFAGRWRLAMTGVLLAVVASGIVYFTQFASLPARERVTTTNGGSGRSDLWTVGLRMVDTHPTRGVGVGNFPVVSRNYVLQPGTLRRSDLIFSAAPKIAHNTYLQVLAETGVLGLMLFCGVILACVGCALRAARLWAQHSDRTMEALARGLLLGLIAMLVADFFISQMYSKLLWVGLALGPVMLAIARREAPRSDLALVD
jgi:O-antigen ligase